MSVDTINNLGVEKSPSFGWEDVAIVVMDPTFDSNRTDTESSSNLKQRKAPQHLLGTNSSFERPHDSPSFPKRELDLPNALRVGSSDDSYSCSSESTDSVNCEGVVASRRDSLTSPFRNESMITKIITTAKSPSSVKRKKVNFTTVEVRDYDLTLGNHPYCEMYPLSLDWEYVELLTTSVDEYEENHRRHVPTATKIVTPIIFRRSNRRNSTVNVRARKLTVTDRMSLLREFTGLTSQQLFQQERKRQLLAQDEKVTAMFSESAET